MTRTDILIANYYQRDGYTPEHIAGLMGLPLRDVWDVTDMCDSAERDAETEGE